MHVSDKLGENYMILKKLDEGEATHRRLQWDGRPSIDGYSEMGGHP